MLLHRSDLNISEIFRHFFAFFASGHVRPPDRSSTTHAFSNDIYTHKRPRRYVAETAMGTDHVKVSTGRVTRSQSLEEIPVCLCPIDQEKTLTGDTCFHCTELCVPYLWIHLKYERATVWLKDHEVPGSVGL